MKEEAIFCISTGSPLPYGVSLEGDCVNFSLFSKHAESVTLCLFDIEKQHLIFKILLDPRFNKTGDIWHLKIQGLFPPFYYGYQVEGPKKMGFCPDKILIDPYAKSVSSSHLWGSQNGYSPLGIFYLPTPFDWENVSPPGFDVKDLVIYEMHIRGFTQHPSSNVKNPGTYLGMVEKIPYLKELGINAVELLPIQEFNENENVFINPIAKTRLYNYWGYSTVNYFSPMNRYATGSEIDAAVIEFKTLVRELHRNGIEVILDIVFNHTSEGNGSCISFKGIDAPVYYILDLEYLHTNYTGCGNTFNCNHPVALQFILDVLRYWALEMKVDGFRFDLASTLTRGRNGHPLEFAPLIEAISEDPILANVKLFAEPWDPGGLYHVGKFYPHTKRWEEWNDKYRDSIRKFIKGTSGSKGEFVTRLCGSEDLYYQRSPFNSVNFITVHDGFTLRDLVSYNDKHNEINGEGNQDGVNYNISWNCGVEGPSENTEIILIRERQMKNFHLALMVSKGIPLLLMGDEYGHTKFGNNNTWCHDNELNWFLWHQLKTNNGFRRFYAGLIHLRMQHPLLRKNTFVKPDEVHWHGAEPYHPDWDPSNQFIGLTLLNENREESLYIAFNAQDKIFKAVLPPAANNKKWHIRVQTHQPSPCDFFEQHNAQALEKLELEFPAYSAALLELY